MVLSRNLEKIEDQAVDDIFRAILRDGALNPMTELSPYISARSPVSDIGTSAKRIPAWGRSCSAILLDKFGIAAVGENDLAVPCAARSALPFRKARSLLKSGGTLKNGVPRAIAMLATEHDGALIKIGQPQPTIDAASGLAMCDRRFRGLSLAGHPARHANQSCVVIGKRTPTRFPAPVRGRRCGCTPVVGRNTGGLTVRRCVRRVEGHPVAARHMGVRRRRVEEQARGYRCQNGTDHDRQSVHGLFPLPDPVCASRSLAPATNSNATAVHRGCRGRFCDRDIRDGHTRGLRPVSPDRAKTGNPVFTKP